MGWWSVAARSVTLSKRENKIGVLRMSSVLGGSRTRSVLGRSVLGGDDLNGSTNELLATTMMATLSLSTFSICKMWFKGKTTMEMVLRMRRGILRLKCKTFSV